MIFPACNINVFYEMENIINLILKVTKWLIDIKRKRIQKQVWNGYRRIIKTAYLQERCGVLFINRQKLDLLHLLSPALEWRKREKCVYEHNCRHYWNHHTNMSLITGCWATELNNNRSCSPEKNKHSMIPGFLSSQVLMYLAIVIYLDNF